MFDSFFGSRHYVIDGINIELSKGHMLEKYQKDFCMYDRILPYIAQMSSGGWIVDIGANVGDTTAAMVKHTDSSFLCIEPNDVFYTLLERNVKRIKEHCNNSIKIYQSFVSQVSDEMYEMNVHDGTAYKVKSNGTSSVPSFTLMDCLKVNGVDVASVDVIKVDTDGYDYECILGMGDNLKNISPILFWENAFEDGGKEKAFAGYSKLGKYLKAMQYARFWIFDNFGNFLCECDYKVYENINDYLRRLSELKTGTTFYYIDVIACKEDKVESVRHNVNEYCKSFER